MIFFGYQWEVLCISRSEERLEETLEAFVIDVKGILDCHFSLIEFAYNNGYHSKIANVSIWGSLW